jgi:glycerol-3-phosphate acyltransferase PlsY
MLIILIVAALSYLIGSIPTSIIFSELYKEIDIREYGSKNAGATNVFRVLGPIPGMAVLLIDAAKGLVSVVIISQIATGTPLNLDPVYLKLLAAAAATVGHVYTVFAGMKGGKGIGTGAGALLGLIPREVGLALVVFLIVLAIFRYVSLGSLTAAVFIGMAVTVEKFVMRFQIPTVLLVTCWVLTVLVFYTHRENIKRLISGTERKIGEKA